MGDDQAPIFLIENMEASTENRTSRMKMHGKKHGDMYG
jgi:hypothetical protein